MLNDMLKYYKKENVYEESLNRIRYLYDEFRDIVVSYSGGKDSSILFHLAMKVAKEKKRLPLKVMFIDQEAEWQSTIHLMRKIMYRKDVIPYWYQMPIKLFNATSMFQDWLYCWEEGRKWMREKESISIKENNYGTDRFKELFIAIPEKEFEGKDLALLGGVRTEETPARALAMLQRTYKWITWGKRHFSKKDLRKQFTFYPIYDWSYTDIWKTIYDNNIEYNTIYNKQYQWGIPLQKMRVSNLHHETAVTSLFYLQEAEPETYQLLTSRLRGIDSAGKFGIDDYYIKELPFMFESWKEYRDYLLIHLIKEEYRKHFQIRFDNNDIEFSNLPEKKKNSIYKTEINALLANDWNGTKLNNLRVKISTKASRKKYRELTGSKKYEKGKRNNPISIQ